jgi:gluconate 2-dehydrogenase gamma chain
MSEITRRQALTQLAAAFAAGATIDHWLAKDAHAAVRTAQAGQAATGAAGRALAAHEYATLERLTDLIVPVENGKPGALGAGVPAWIDALINVNDDLKGRYATGIAWLDQTMTAQNNVDFIGATAAQQAALLDVIAFRENRTPDNTTGIDFYTLLRRMTVDGFYTSDAGIRDVNPGGRPPYATFVVPQESVDYVISRSPFK